MLSCKDKEHMVKSILVCLAHPDDEVGLGPLIARYVAQGVQATLICTTNGDVGTVDEKHLQGYSSIPELRLAELYCATKAIGFTEVVTFGYRDSGMMGSRDNRHPDSLWQAPLEEVTQKVVEVMRRVRPQVVITFNTYGVYGHPDHIKTHQATLEAFRLLQAEPEHPQKLYYTCIRKIWLGIRFVLMRLHRQDPRKAGRNADVDLVAAYEAIDPVTTKVATGEYLEVALTAAACYASQIEMSQWAHRLRRIVGPLVIGTTGLYRVVPAHQSGARIEYDVFEGVIDEPDTLPAYP
jgi:LmbE family N-acetylglucosaminyl deacetylase